MKLRISVPTTGMASKYLTGNWRYVMPDSRIKSNSVIESTFEFNRVHEIKPTGREDERAAKISV